MPVWLEEILCVFSNLWNYYVSANKVKISLVLHFPSKLLLCKWSWRGRSRNFLTSHLEFLKVFRSIFLVLRFVRALRKEWSEVLNSPSSYSFCPYVGYIQSKSYCCNVQKYEGRPMTIYTFKNFKEICVGLIFWLHMVITKWRWYLGMLVRK